jgi:hypothetical protein
MQNRKQEGFARLISATYGIFARFQTVAGLTPQMIEHLTPENRPGKLDKIRFNNMASG